MSWLLRRFAGVRFSEPNEDFDHDQMGVRAVDRDGNRSPVAFAVPANNQASGRAAAAGCRRGPSESP